ncbi:hypothetical protein Z043_120088, partial [Scleropages formosus]
RSTHRAVRVHVVSPALGLGLAAAPPRLRPFRSAPPLTHRRLAGCARGRTEGWQAGRERVSGRRADCAAREHSGSTGARPGLSSCPVLSLTSRVGGEAEMTPLELAGHGLALFGFVLFIVLWLMHFISIIYV